MRLSSGGWSMQGPHQAAQGRESRARWSRGRSGPQAKILSSMSCARLMRECREVSRHELDPRGCRSCGADGFYCGAGRGRGGRRIPIRDPARPGRKRPTLNVRGPVRPAEPHSSRRAVHRGIRDPRPGSKRINVNPQLPGIRKQPRVGPNNHTQHRQERRSASVSVVIMLP
jgi:hypothetical protein